MIVLNICLSVVILVESIMAYKLYRAYKRKLLKEELLVQALDEKIDQECTNCGCTMIVENQKTEIIKNKVSAVESHLKINNR